MFYLKIYLFYKVNYFIIFIKFLYIQQRNCHKQFVCDLLCLHSQAMLEIN